MLHTFPCNSSTYQFIIKISNFCLDNWAIIVSKVINARIRKVYDVCKGIQIKITDAIPDICDTIEAYRDDNGNKYLKIKTDNDTTYEIFSKEKIWNLV